jgi:hypothetical protein
MVTDLVAAVFRSSNAFLPVVHQPGVHALADDSMPFGNLGHRNTDADFSTARYLCSATLNSHTMSGECQHQAKPKWPSIKRDSTRWFVLRYTNADLDVWVCPRHRNVIPGRAGRHGMGNLGLGPAGVALTVSDTYLGEAASSSGWGTPRSGCREGRSIIWAARGDREGYDGGAGGSAIISVDAHPVERVCAFFMGRWTRARGPAWWAWAGRSSRGRFLR